MTKENAAALKRTGSLAAEGKRLRVRIRKTRDNRLKANLRFGDIAEGASEAILVLDSEHSIVLFNSAAENLFGYQRAEVLGKPLDLILPERMVQSHRELIREFAASGETVRPMKKRLAVGARRKDGTEFPVEIGLSKLQEGEQQFYAAFIVDVTERRLTEQALLESEASYRALFEDNPQPMYSYDPDTLRFLAVNNTALDKYGYRRDEFLQMTIADIHLTEDVDRLLKDVKNTIHDSQRSGGWRHRLKDGTLIDVEISSHRLNLSGHPSILVLANDITQRKRVEEQVASQANLIAQVNDAVIAMDRNFVVSSWNQGAEQIYGWTADEAIGQSTEKVFRAEFATTTLAEVRKQIQEKGEYVGEVIQYRKDGTRIFVDGHTTALRDKTGSITGYLTVNRDTTERRRAEQEIQKRSEQLEALRQISLGLTAELNLGALLNSIVQRAIPLIGAQTCSCYLLREDQQLLEQVTLTGAPQLATDQRTRRRGEGLIGQVWERNEPIAVDDYQKWKLARSVYANVPSRAVMGVPIRWGKKFLGVLVLTAELPHHFSQNEIELLSQFADQAAIAIQNARLFEETRRRADEFEAMFSVGRELSQQHDLSAILNRFADSAMKLVHAPAVTLSIYDDSKGALETVVAKNFPAALIRTVRLGEGVSGRVAATRNYMIVDDYRNSEFRMTGMGSVIRAQVQVPMLYRGELLGVLSLHELGESTRQFKVADANILMLLAGQAAGVVHSARLLNETQRHAEQLSTLNEISNVVSAHLEVDSVLDVIHQQVSRILPLDVFYIALYDNQTELLTFPLLYDEGSRFEQTPISPRNGTEINKVIETGRPVLRNRTPEEIVAPIDPQIQKTANPKRSASLLFVPLKHGTRIIGVMSTQSYALNVYNEEHLALLSGIANQVSVAIENARLFGEAEQNLQRVQALRQIDRAIAGDFDLQVTINSFLTHVVAQLGVDAADVLVLKPQTQTLEFTQGIGFHTPALQHTHLRLGDGLAGKAALERRNIVISDFIREIDGMAASPLIQSEGFVAYRGIPLIAKGRVNGVLEIFHRSPLPTNQEWIEYLETLAGQAAIAIENAELLENLQRSNIDLALAYDTTLEGWSRALDLRDHETEGHTRRVTEITLRLAREMGISEAELVHMRRGGLLHDIGKMGIPDSILLKAGELSEQEWEIMRQHPENAFQLLSPITFLKPALDIPYCHHEKWDGTGYPRGLKGEQIPLAARIFAVVDVWDALRSNRVYRPAWTKDKAREHIRSLSGKYFEPKVVDAFFGLNLEA